MINLAVNYLGLPLAHPIMPGASSLADDLDQVRRLEDAGAPAIVLSSLFEEEILRQGIAQPFHRHRQGTAFLESTPPWPVPHGLFIPARYYEHLRQVKAAVSVPVIASLNGSHPGGWLDQAAAIEAAGADAIELNFYFLPTNPEDAGHYVETRLLETVRALVQATHLPIAVKLTPFYSSLPHLAAQLQAAGASALILFSRFHENIDVHRRCGIVEFSAPAELLMRLHWATILSSQIAIPLVITGGVHDPTDVVRAIMAGATAVECVSCLYRHGPSYLNTLRVGLIDFLKENNCATIDELRGCLARRNRANLEAEERFGYARSLHTNPGMTAPGL